jgi:DNA (cytosine-5)-methyltransferase 1
MGYVEYLRPRYFILENVKRFLSADGGAFSRGVFKTLVQIGYQFSTGVLQAGQYFVPQSRNRLFIVAAAPGEKLCFLPGPLTTFPVVGISFQLLAFPGSKETGCLVRFCVDFYN